MTDTEKEVLLRKMTDSLPVLRKQAGLTQNELADLIGVSTYTVLAIEKRRRPMSWGTFLSLILVFGKNPKTKNMLGFFGIHTPAFNQYLECSGLEKNQPEREN